MNSEERHRLRREKMIGKKYGRLTIVGFEFIEKRKRYYAKCKCDCGNEIIVDQNKLITGHTKSCGCHNHDSIVYRNKYILSTHNLSNHPMEHIWRNQYARCNNKNDSSYERYGGKGIKCIWTLEEACKWYDENPRPSKDYTLDRIDPNGNYEVNNVRWATLYVQAINKSKYDDWKNIYKTSNNKYRVSMNIYGIYFTKTLNTYEEAIEYRNYLKEMREDMYFND